MADVFISYQNDDRERVRPLVLALRSRRLSVWWAEDILPGAHWLPTIQRELDSALTVLVVWTRRSLSSHSVLTEAGEGLRRGCLVQVTIEAVRWPSLFAGVQSADLTHWYGEPDHPAFLKVCAGIDAQLGNQPKTRIVETDPFRFVGVVLSYDASIGRGRIQSDDGGRPVEVQYKDVVQAGLQRLKQGQRISYLIGVGLTGGNQDDYFAVDLKLLRE